MTALIEEITATIERLVEESPQARLLMTVPGISYYSALLILSEIGEVERFPSAKHLCSYAGLVPSIYKFGEQVLPLSILRKPRSVFLIPATAGTHASTPLQLICQQKRPRFHIF